MTRPGIGHFVFACILAASLYGCAVDPDYTSDKIKNINPEVTLFENGISFPMIRSTAELRADSLVKRIEDPQIREMLNVEDGKYELKFTGYENFDSFIKDLKLADVLKLDPIEEDVTFSFEYGDIDPEKLKSEACHFGDEATMPDLSAISDIGVNPLDETVTVDTDLKGRDFDIDIDVDPFRRVQTLISKSAINAAGSVSPTESVSLPASTVGLDVQPQSISAFTIPSSIRKVNSVTLKDDAGIVVSLSLSNSVLTEGTITPDVDLDLSDLLFFEGGAGTLDLSSMILNQSNGFSCTKSFPVSGVNVAGLTAAKSISVSGTVSIGGAKSTKALCAAAAGDLGISISISFRDFDVKSAICELNAVEASADKTIRMEVGDISIPSSVKSVEYVTFSEESNVTLQLSAANLDRIPGAELKANTLIVTFPEGLTVSGDNVVDNVLTLRNVDLGGGIAEAVVKLSRLNLPAPVDGKISFSPEIRVEANCTAGGTVNTADLKNLPGDVSVVAKVTGVLKVADFRATVNEFKATIPTTRGTIAFEVPERAALYGEFTIIPQGRPEITVRMTLPDLDGLTLSAGDGISVKLPYFIVLGDFSYPELTYDKETNTIVINQIKDKTLTFPVEKLQAKAKEKSTSGYQVSGEYEVKGTVSLAQATIGKSTLDKISGARFGVSADIPSINAAKLSVESLSFDINENFDFEALKSKDIPGELVGIEDVALKDVAARIGLELEGLPSIGSASQYIVDIRADLPSFVKPSTIYVKSAVKDGKVTGYSVPLEGFDLSGYDFQKMKAEGKNLEGKIKVVGSIYAENPEVDLSTLTGKVEGKLKAKISDPDDKIKVKSMRSKLDYKLDTAMFFNMTELNKSLKDFNFELPDISAVLGVRSNLAVPADAAARVVPVKGVTEDGTKAISMALDFPYCQNPAESDTVTNKFTLNINDILNSRPDSVKVSVCLSTDKSRDCYIEPEAEYKLGIGYDVRIPLRLGEGTSLEITDTLDLDGSMSGLEEILSKSSFGVTGNIESTFPVGLKLKIDFLSYDKAKSVYARVPLKSVETSLLEPNSASSFSIVTGPEKSGTTIPEITHLRVSCKLTSDGEEIGPDNYLKIKDLTIVLPDGITVNPDNM